MACRDSPSLVSVAVQNPRSIELAGRSVEPAGPAERNFRRDPECPSQAFCCLGGRSQAVPLRPKLLYGCLWESVHSRMINNPALRIIRPLIPCCLHGLTLIEIDDLTIREADLVPDGTCPRNLRREYIQIRSRRCSGSVSLRRLSLPSAMTILFGASSCDCGSSPLRFARPGFIQAGLTGGRFFLRVSPRPPPTSGNSPKGIQRSRGSFSSIRPQAPPSG